MKFPFRDKSTSPSAMALEEKTLIIVSLETTGLLMPSRAPIAMPVRAEWPRASEKKASLWSTTMVPIIPNNGVIRRIARKAFFIKSYCIQEKGRMVSKKE